MIEVLKKARVWAARRALPATVGRRFDPKKAGENDGNPANEHQSFAGIGTRESLSYRLKAMLVTREGIVQRE
jgi:hypothetical protein